MLPVPASMLNRRNGQLYQRLLALQSELHEKRSHIRMEKGVVEDTRARVAEANRALVLLRKRQSDMLSSSDHDRERVTAVSVEVERLSKQLAALNGNVAESARQAGQMALVVDDARAKLKAAEEEGQRLEEVVAEWVRENRETGKAEATAQIVMGRVGAAIKHRLEKCNALSATCHELQDEYEEEKDAALQLRQQVAALREQASADGLEVDNLRNRIAELANVCAALDEAISIKAQLMGTLSHQTEEMRRSRDEFRARHERELAAVATMERLDRESRGRKDACTAKVRDNEGTLRDAEDGARTLERTVDLTDMHRLKLEKAVAGQKEELHAIAARLQELEAVRHNAAQAEKGVERELDGVKRAEVSAAALGAMTQIRLGQAEQRFERSRQQLRDVINKSQTAALETAQLNEMVQRCQKRLRVSVVEERVQAEAAQLEQRIAHMSEQIDKAAERLAYARGLSVDDPEMIRRRALLKERASALEAELDSVSREHSERDRAVRTASRRLSAETAAGNFLQADVQRAQSETVAMEKENAAFYRELDELVAARQGRAALVEGLWAKIHSAEQRVASGSTTVLEAQQVRIQMERDAAQRLAQIEADKATLQHLLNAQENDRHRTAMRLREMTDMVEILAARYNGVVHLLQVKVGTADEQITDAMTAEDMQARMMMQRAEQREELQSRGDALDQQIVKCEREVLMLERALKHAREHVMDLRALEAPPELDQAWQVVLRVEQERRSSEQAQELMEKIRIVEEGMAAAEQRAGAEMAKYAVIAEALDAAQAEHDALVKELRTIDKSRHLTTVEHNRARVVSRKLAVNKASAVPANAKAAPQQSVVPRMPRAQALHQALTSTGRRL